MLNLKRKLMSLFSFINEKMSFYGKMTFLSHLNQK